MRPYTDVRQWPLSFIRPRNVSQLRRMPVGRYCSLPGIWGAYAFAPLHGRPTMADDVRSPPKWFPMAADACRALLFSAMNMGGVCFCAPTRTSDNGRCRSFAPEMFFDCGGCLSGAIVLGPEHRGRMQYAPTRMSDNGRCRSFAPEMFSDCGGCLSGAIIPYREHGGAYAIRPYTGVRQWPLTFVRPRNVFRLRRYLSGAIILGHEHGGAYAIRPYTDVRQWLLTFICPRRNPFYRPSHPIRR